MQDRHPLVTFAPGSTSLPPESWRRELHVRNSDEPVPAPWILAFVLPPAPTTP